MTEQDEYSFPTWETDIAEHHRKSYVFRAVTSHSEAQPFPFVGMTSREIEKEIDEVCRAAVIAAKILYPAKSE